MPVDECFTTATNIHGTSSNLKSHSPPAIVFAGLACSVASLAIGLIIGLSALAGNNGFTLNQGMASDIAFHPDLMVFGVIGGLLVTEKLELMEFSSRLEQMKDEHEEARKAVHRLAELSMATRNKRAYAVWTSLENHVLLEQRALRLAESTARSILLKD